MILEVPIILRAGDATPKNIVLYTAIPAYQYDLAQPSAAQVQSGVVFGPPYFTKTGTLAAGGAGGGIKYVGRGGFAG